MNKIIENALNRGAPIDTPIMINLYDFLTIFENEGLVKECRNSSKEIISKISNIMDLYGGDIILPIYATISMDESNSKILRFSGENYYFSILGLLKGMNDSEIIDACDDRKKFKNLREKILSLKA